MGWHLKKKEYHYFICYENHFFLILELLNLITGPVALVL